MISALRLSPFAVLPCLFHVLSADAERITVTIAKMAFSPTAISAKVGDSVEWLNKDAFAHTATVQGRWEVMLRVKKSGSITFNKAETIDYLCRFHPN